MLDSYSEVNDQPTDDMPRLIERTLGGETIYWIEHRNPEDKENPSGAQKSWRSPRFQDPSALDTWAADPTVRANDPLNGNPVDKLVNPDGVVLDLVVT